MQASPCSSALAHTATTQSLPFLPLPTQPDGSPRQTVPKEVLESISRNGCCLKGTLFTELNLKNTNTQSLNVQLRKVGCGWRAAALPSTARLYRVPCAIAGLVSPAGLGFVGEPRARHQHPQCVQSCSHLNSICQAVPHRALPFWHRLEDPL